MIALFISRKQQHFVFCRNVATERSTALQMLIVHFFVLICFLSLSLILDISLHLSLSLNLSFSLTPIRCSRGPHSYSYMLFVPVAVLEVNFRFFYVLVKLTFISNFFKWIEKLIYSASTHRWRRSCDLEIKEYFGLN